VETRSRSRRSSRSTAVPAHGMAITRGLRLWLVGMRVTQSGTGRPRRGSRASWDLFCRMRLRLCSMARNPEGSRREPFARRSVQPAPGSAVEPAKCVPSAAVFPGRAGFGWALYHRAVLLGRRSCGRVHASGRSPAAWPPPLSGYCLAGRQRRGPAEGCRLSASRGPCGGSAGVKWVKD
jgi:hypothetical protein